MWRAVLLSVVVLASATAADAQQLWGEIMLPGGAAAARVVADVGDPHDRPDSTWLLDFLRINGWRVASPQVEGFRRYITVLNVAQTQNDQWPNGFTLPTSETPRDARNKVERTVESLGLELRSDNRIYSVRAANSDDARQRAAWLKLAGADPAPFVAPLNAGRPATVRLLQTRLPLPLPDFWKTEVFERDLPPIVSVVHNRPLALTYLGLMSLDDETLTFLAGRPRLVRQLGEDVGPAFAAFGRSIHVRGGHVECPGGEAARRIWEELVGRPAQDTERFVTALLGADEGRLAYFFDAVAHLDPARQQAILGANDDPRARTSFVRDVYSQFARVDPLWKITDNPFKRPPLDPVLVLRFVNVLADGTVGPTWWRSLCQRLSDSNGWPEKVAAPRKNEPVADLRWVLSWIFEKPALADTRFRQIRLLQRLFVELPQSHALSAEIALRTLEELPMVPLTLERMGVTDPAVYQTVGRAAKVLTDGAARDAIAPVEQWQAALGLMEQIQRRVRMPQDKVGALLKSLAAIPLQKEALRRGAVAAWISEQLVPALVPADPLDDLEQRALKAFTSVAIERLRFPWEGLEYAVDRAGPALRTASAMRMATVGARLQDVVVLRRIRRDIEAGAKSLADAQAIGRRLAATEPAVMSLPKVDGKPQEIVGRFHDVVANAGKIREAGDVGRLEKSLGVIDDAVDAVAYYVAASIEYALAASPAPQPQSLAAMSSWHALLPLGERLLADATLNWRRAAWEVARIDARPSGGGTLLRGALLGIDVALAQVRLGGLTASEPPTGFRADEQIIGPIVRAIALDESVTFRAAGRWDRLAANMVAGRQRLAAWQRDPAAADVGPALRRAGVDEWRTNVILWELQRSEMLKTPFAALKPLEIADIGAGDRGPLPLLIPGVTIDGCLCALEVGRLAAEDLRGRARVTLALLMDLPARVAEVLLDLKLPPSLVSDLLAPAIQDWVDHMRMSWFGDWEGLAAWPTHLTRERIEEYLLSAVSTGIFAPPRTR